MIEKKLLRFIPSNICLSNTTCTPGYNPFSHGSGYIPKKKLGLNRWLFTKGMHGKKGRFGNVDTRVLQRQCKKNADSASTRNVVHAIRRGSANHHHTSTM